MRKLFFLVILIILMPGCSKQANNSTASIVKPKYHHRWYKRNKDKRTKRTKIVRMH